jgi:hypothetical protein
VVVGEAVEVALGVALAVGVAVGAPWAHARGPQTPRKTATIRTPWFLTRSPGPRPLPSRGT